jgi:hypothetical protein
MFGSRTTRIRRARLVPIALTTAALSSAVLGASVTGTLSGYVASVTNTQNTASSGSLVMKETGPGAGGAVTCLSSSGADNSYASCSTINKYGGTAFTPGTTHTVNVTIANMGTATVTGFTLRPDLCTKTDLNGTVNSGNLCGALKLTLTCSVASGASVDVYRDATLSAVASGGEKTIPSACSPGAGDSGATQFAFALTLPTSADSSVQSQQVSQPLTWTFTGA